MNKSLPTSFAATFEEFPEAAFIYLFLLFKSKVLLIAIYLLQPERIGLQFLNKNFFCLRLSFRVLE
jgi:hypothetical protein